jgi:hypothetical protein
MINEIKLACASDKFLLSSNRLKGHLSCQRPYFYERAVSDLDRSINISLWVKVVHSSFTEGSHMTKNTASELVNCRPSFGSK